MLGISKVWENMSNIDQAALIELIAGKQRGNSITALLTSMSQAEKILNSSLNSEGSAMEEQETRMDSLEAKITQLKASFESLSSTVINGDFLKGLVDFGTKGVQGIDKLITAFGGFKGVLAATIAAFALFKRNSSMDFLSKISDSIKNTGNGFKGYGIYFSDQYKKHQTDTNKKGQQISSAKAYRRAMGDTASKALGLTTALGKVNFAIAAVSAVATAGCAIYSHYKQKQEDARQSAVEGLEVYKETESTIASYSDRIKQLRESLDSGELSNDEAYSIRSELLAIEQEITTQYGAQVGQIDLINGGLTTTLSLLQDISTEQLKQWYRENATAVDKSVEMMINPTSDEKHATKGRGLSNPNSSMTKELKDIYSNSFSGLSFVKSQDGNSYRPVVAEEAKTDAYTMYKEWSNAFDEIKKKRDEFKEGSAKWNDWEEERKYAEAQISGYKSLIKANEENFNKRMQSLLSEEGSPYASTWTNIQDSINKINELEKAGDRNGAKTSYETAKRQFESLMDLAEEYGQQNLIDGLPLLFDKFQQQFSKFEPELNFKDPTDDLAQQIKTASQSFMKDGQIVVDDAFKEAGNEYLKNRDNPELLSDLAKQYGELEKAREKYNEENETEYKMEDFVNYLNSLGNLEEAFKTVGEIGTEFSDSLSKNMEKGFNTDKAKDNMRNLIDEIYKLSPEQFGEFNIGEKLGLGDVNVDWSSSNSIIEWLDGITDAAELTAGQLDVISMILSTLGVSDEEIQNIMLGFKPDKESAGEAGKEGSKEAQEEADKNPIYPKVNRTTEDESEVDTKDSEKKGEKDGESYGKGYSKAAKEKIDEVADTAKKKSKEKTKETEKGTTKINKEKTEVSVEFKADKKTAGKAGKEGSKQAQKEANKNPVRTKTKSSTKTTGKTKLTQTIQAQPIKATVDTSTALGKLNTLKGQLNGLQGKNIKINATGNAKSVISSIKSQIANLPLTKTITVTVKKIGSAIGNLFHAEGTYHNMPILPARSGSAKASGDNQIKKDQTALVGELGQELVASTSTGTWHTVGDRGAEFTELKHGDIVFNARQTRELLQHGKIQSRGKIFANGTALAPGTSLSPSRSRRIGKNIAFIDIGIDDTSIEEKLKDALEKLDKAVDRILGNYEHRVKILEYQNVDTSRIIAEYEKMQKYVHDQAEEYRKQGLSENADAIEELTEKWWEYSDKIKELREKEYEDLLKNNENAIKLTENWLDNAVTDADYNGIKKYVKDTIAYYKNMQETIQAQANYYRALGYSDTSDEVSELSNKWWEYAEKINTILKDSYDKMVEDATKSLSSIADAYEKLKDAAEEYSEINGLSVDTYQDILDLGVEYISLLKDENGNLVINEDKIKKIISARKEQLGVETALSYLEQVREAYTNNNTIAMEKLLNATDKVSDSTWALVYAQASFMGLPADKTKQLISNLDNIYSLTKAVTDNTKDDAEEIANSLDDILDYVIQIIEQEADDKIEALDKQVDEYKKIIDLQKESLQLTKEQDEYNDEVGDKLKNISDLERRIQQLSLDDSREAQAEREKLLEDLYEKQKDLNKYQAEHSYNATVDSLEKQADAFEEEKEKEKEAIEKSISSYQKKYDLALQYIRDNYSSLYDELYEWNYEYGSDLTVTIKKSWEEALEAAKKYGEGVEAMIKSIEMKNNTFNNGEGNSKDGENHITVAPFEHGGEEFNRAMGELGTKMKENSDEWKYASDSKRAELNRENLELAKGVGDKFGIDLVRGNDGVWYVGGVGGDKLYEKYADYINPDTEALQRYNKIRSLVLAMRRSSLMWKLATDDEEKVQLANNNVLYAKQIQDISGETILRDDNGVWYIGSISDKNRLYDRFTFSQDELRVPNHNFLKRFHSGGIIGGEDSLKDKEVLSVLEKGEMVLDKRKKQSLYRAIDENSAAFVLMNKFQKGIESGVFDIKAQVNESLKQELNSVPVGNTTNNKTEIHIDASVQINGDVDKDNWSKIQTALKDHSRQVADIVNRETTKAFSKRGVFS